MFRALPLDLYHSECPEQFIFDNIVSENQGDWYPSVAGKRVYCVPRLPQSRSSFDSVLVRCSCSYSWFLRGQSENWIHLQCKFCLTSSGEISLQVFPLAGMHLQLSQGFSERENMFKAIVA